MQKDAMEVKTAARRANWFRGSLAGFVTVLLLAASLPSGATNLVDREYADAVHSFQIGRTSEAFGQFTALADRGDVDSARIALFLYSYGQSLYAKQWDATPHQIAHWSTLVGNSATAGRAIDALQPAAHAAQPRAGLTTVSTAR